MVKYAAAVLESIKARCAHERDCWLWLGYATKSGHPMMRVNGGGPAYVRRVALGCVGRSPGARVPVVPACGDKRCCNPAHLQATTCSAVSQGVAERGKGSMAQRAQKIAVARRAQSRLTQDAVRDIRSGCGSARDVAQQHGVSVSRVYAIRRGDSWRELGLELAQPHHKQCARENCDAF